MNNTLTGTVSLLRFQLHRMRVFLALWFLGMTVVSWIVAVSFPKTYATQAKRDAFAESLDNAASLALTGPRTYLSDYTAGAMLTHQMLLWTGSLTAVMVILLVTRLTRFDEETSRLELVRSQPVGRHADLTATLLLATVASVAIGVGMSLSVASIEGASFSSIALYGAAHTALGIVFAAVTAVAAQLASYTSTTYGIAFTTLAIAFLLRTWGDAQKNAASWFSPIGWSQRTYVFTDEQQWWPLLLPAGLTLVGVAAAFFLVNHRDFGQGVLPARAGRMHASGILRGARSLTVHLTWGLTLAGVVAIGALGAVYGSILADVEKQFDSSPELRDAVFGDLTEHASFIDSYASFTARSCALFAMIFGLITIGKAYRQETSGVGELLASLPLTRRVWPGFYLVMGWIISLLALAVGGVAMGGAGAASIGKGEYVGKLFVAVLQYFPAAWLLVAVSFLLYGWIPRIGVLRWVPWLWVLFVAFFGAALKFPDWMLKTSPLEHVASYPAEELHWTPLGVMLLFAAALAALGYVGLSRRDLQTSD